LRTYSVVVNDCATPAVPSPIQIRTRDTDYGGRNFSLSFNDLAKGLPAPLSPQQLDLLETVCHLYAVDKACERGEDDLDWSRQIDVWLPVREPDFWAGQADPLQQVFKRLTSDDIKLRFELETDPQQPPRQRATPFADHDSIALLSGGMDSFVGAVDLQAAGGRPLLLSHPASGATNTAQSAVEGILRGRHSDLVRVKLSAARARGSDLAGSEPSERSRTLMFIGAAAVLAVAGGSRQIYLNENGIMALHLPLTAARVGSLSTQTAAPPILERMRVLCEAALGGPIALDNGLVNLTKPEVVERAVDLGYESDLQETVSCWAIGRTRTHCGICVPCLMRRISCELHGVVDVPYDRDLFEDSAEPADARAQDNLTHIVAFVDDLVELADHELEVEYPEILNGRPMLSHEEARDLHRRWGDQASGVLFGHSQPPRVR
jgi:Queuosine biosynthesis protein QueC